MCQLIQVQIDSLYLSYSPSLTLCPSCPQAAADWWPDKFLKAFVVTDVSAHRLGAMKTRRGDRTERGTRGYRERKRDRDLMVGVTPVGTFFQVMLN